MIRFLFNIYSRLPYKYMLLVAKLSFILRPILIFFPKSIKLGSYKMFLDTKDNANYRYRKHGDNYEKTLVDGFLNFISNNPKSYVIDVGASYGAYTLKAANIGQYGLVKKIFSFEPDETVFQSLEKSIDANKFSDLIDLNKFIIGDYDGEANLLLSHRASTSNQTFFSRQNTTASKSSVSVPCTTLDSFLDTELNFSDESFIIKIDVEGSELRVLKGMKNILSSSKGYALFCEYYPQGIIDCGNSIEDFKKYITDIKADQFLIVKNAKLKKISKDDLFNIFKKLDEQSNSLESLIAFEFVASYNLEFQD